MKAKFCDHLKTSETTVKGIKMEKTPRYTQRERNMVLGYAAQYKDVIENKRTDAESNRKKDEVWRVIAKEFNCRVYHQRSAKQLRQLYKNMKLLLKKDLCSSGKSSKSFMDILEALSQQDSINQYLSSNGSPNGTPYSGRQPSKIEFDSDTKMASTFDNDVIVIKSEDISDNDQSSSMHNGDMDDEDDCLSNKDIPEVCLEEEDEEIFSRPSTQQAHDIMMRGLHNNAGRRKSNDNHHHGNINLSSSSSHISPEGTNSKNEFLLNLAIEERKRKIDLLNAQIDYWKALTRKLEVTGSACSGPHSSCTPTCHCHLPKMNGHNQS